MEMCRSRLTGPSAWVGTEIEDGSSWLEVLDDAGLAAIDEALDEVERQGVGIPFDRSDFPLRGLGNLLQRIPEHLEDGPGFVLVRGLPREKYTVEQCQLIAAASSMSSQSDVIDAASRRHPHANAVLPSRQRNRHDVHRTDRIAAAAHAAPIAIVEGPELFPDTS